MSVLSFFILLLLSPLPTLLLLQLCPLCLFYPFSSFSSCPPSFFFYSFVHYVLSFFILLLLSSSLPFFFYSFVHYVCFILFYPSPPVPPPSFFFYSFVHYVLSFFILLLLSSSLPFFFYSFVHYVCFILFHPSPPVPPPSSSTALSTMAVLRRSLPKYGPSVDEPAVCSWHLWSRGSWCWRRCWRRWSCSTSRWHTGEECCRSPRAGVLKQRVPSVTWRCSPVCSEPTTRGWWSCQQQQNDKRSLTRKNQAAFPCELGQALRRVIPRKEHDQQSVTRKNKYI